MFKAIMSVIVGLLISHTSAAQSNSQAVISGSIDNLLVGEADPFVLGDICILDVNTAPGVYVGLITDSESCEAHRDELTVGRHLDVVVFSEEMIQDQKQISILRKLSPAKKFYRLDFGGIENGLADLSANTEGVEVIERRTAQAELLCQSVDGQFEAALIPANYLGTGYSLYVVKTSSTGFKNLVLSEEATKASVIKSKAAQLAVNQGKATLKLENKNISMNCKFQAVLEYDVIITFEPRISVGN